MRVCQVFLLRIEPRCKPPIALVIGIVAKCIRWHDAIRTLAKLHRIVPKNVGLENYGRTSGFYDRQVKTWTTICKAQAEQVDVDTKEAVGEIPHSGEILSFFADKKSQPKDRGTPIHGDYKIDNLVFHKTEPRVIGILE